jgi:hypothetical protein
MKSPRSNYVPVEPNFCRFLRFSRLEKPVTYVFSIPLSIPTPPASTIFIFGLAQGESVTLLSTRHKHC